MAWEAIIDKAFNYGVPAALVFVLFAFVGSALWAIAQFVAPMIRESFDKAMKVADKHINYLEISTETMMSVKESSNSGKHSHDKTHDALKPLADAIHAATMPELRQEVKPHVERVKQALE